MGGISLNEDLGAPTHATDQVDFEGALSVMDGATPTKKKKSHLNLRVEKILDLLELGENLLAEVSTYPTSQERQKKKFCPNL